MWIPNRRCCRIEASGHTHTHSCDIPTFFLFFSFLFFLCFWVRQFMLVPRSQGLILYQPVLRNRFFSRSHSHSAPSRVESSTDCYLNWKFKIVPTCSFLPSFLPSRLDVVVVISKERDIITSILQAEGGEKAKMTSVGAGRFESKQTKNELKKKKKKPPPLHSVRWQATSNVRKDLSLL